MTSTPTPEKLTLEGLMQLVMEMAALFRIAPPGLPENFLTLCEEQKAAVRDYASRLIAQSAQEAKGEPQSALLLYCGNEEWDDLLTELEHTKDGYAPDIDAMQRALLVELIHRHRAILASKKETP